jgi:peptidoglycan-associated lipoprotein
MEDQDQEAQDLELATLREQIYFDFDSFELKPQARTRLKEKAMILEESPKLKVIIEGHCDERGTQEYNLALGERRAKAAYEFLLLLGIDANRLQIVSYGEERPAVKGHNEAAWAKNRRCEFKVYK